MSERDRFESFSAYFNLIENYLKRKARPEDGNLKLAQAIYDYRHVHGSPGWLEEFDAIRDLRNVISHSCKFRYPLFVPSQEVVDRLQEIWAALEYPVLADVAFKRDVLTISPNSPLVAALDLTRDNDFSQFPVMENGSVTGLLTENGIVRWMAAHYSDDDWILGLRRHTVHEVLNWEGPRQSYVIAPGSEPAEEVAMRFRRDVDLVAVVITAEGRASDELLGIATADDIARLA